ncbi:hypothetical protein BEL04_19175 [Mucilaginibacter sp. PPCGB 2223]|uniref:hypothetical protein n=1 Tax=Mucilaginibacter sp. PPCGB 2223 TaxID=1886027 RepID=UPI000825F88A|nr:hypothetical protein [Mucilaginibacter sp. PPCGB 2223]OCX50851.1 hypothetical protein BEL04_19175 [Mucilaginibacter sp. PPCGB 2223]
MTKDTLPTYAIVELLIRLAQIGPHIGDYKDHAIYTDTVIVKTTLGHITFSKSLIKAQFNQPELISDTELKNAAATFKPAKKA